MNKRLRQRVIASVLALVMVLGLLPVQFLGGGVEVKAASNVYTFEAKDLEAFAKGAYADGDTMKVGTDDYFTIYMSANTKVDSSNKSWDDEYSSSQRLSFGGKSDVGKSKNFVAIETSAAATVGIWWASGGDGRQVDIFKTDGTIVAQTAVESVVNTPYLSTLEIAEAGTYYIGDLDSSSYIFKIEVTETVAGGTEEPTSEAPTEEPTSEAPTEEPTSEAPTEEPTSEAPTQEPTSEAPTEEPTSEAPTEEPTEGPVVPGAPVDGFTADAVVAGTTYTFDFGANYNKADGVANSHTKGLFSFNAGNTNGAAYHSEQYGIEFKQGNMLTFPVAGDTTIVIGGDSNSNSTSISATATNGTVSPATLAAKTAGHASLEDCLAKGDNTLVYEYTGEAGTVTLTVDDGKAYICYAAIIPVKAPVDGFTVDTVEADTKYTFDFGANYNKADGVANSHTKGLFSFNAGNTNGAAYHSEQYGIEFKQGNMLTFPVAGDTTIVIGGDSNSNSTSISATASNGTVNPTTLPAKTAGHASLEDCLAKGDNTLIYSYTGEAGTVTLTVDDGKAYICYAAILPGATVVEEAVTVMVSGKVADADGAVDGVAGGKLVFANPSGVKTEATIAADGTYSVELVVGVAYTLSIDGVDYKLEGGVDLTNIEADLADQNFVAVYVEPPKTTDMSPTENPLPTLVKSYKVGYEGESGSYEKTATNGFVINGGGEYFGKDTAIDSLFTAGFKVPEGSSVVVTAKLTPNVGEATSGMLGIIGKNDVTEPDSNAYGVYYDVSKKCMRIGRYGGASNVSDVDLATSVYVKVEMNSGGQWTAIARDAEFTDVIYARNGMGVDNCNPTYVGFYATEGTTLTVEDIEIVATYTAEGATTATNKLVYSSAYGELIPSWSKSSDYGRPYTDTTVFTKSVDGNELTFSSTRGSDKGNLRQMEQTDFLLFPKTTENWTIKADLVVSGLDGGTDKQGFAMGQYAIEDDGVHGSSLFVQDKQNRFCAVYSKTGATGNSGNPQSAAINVDGVTTYTMEYKKLAPTEEEIAKEQTCGTAVMKAYDSAGTVIADGSAAPFVFSNGSLAYAAGEEVHYGFASALGKGSVTVSNITLINEAGYVIYDQNDYYIVKGVAPVISEVTATATEDRTAIDVAWTLSDEVEGKGNIQYQIYVSVDGAEYVKAGQSKICEFSYPVKTTGNYKFKVWAVSGESSSEEQAKESVAVDVVKPLDKVTLTAVGDADSVALSWTLSANAVAYDVYRAVTSDGTFEVIATVDAPTDAEATVATYDDTTAEPEVPVYYYVVAKSETNTSNPCETMQALVTAGHTGEFAGAAAVDKLTVTAKTNDTVFDDTFSLTGTYAVNGTLVVKNNGTEVKTVEVTADTAVEVKIDALAEGRNVIDFIFTNGDNVTSRETFTVVNKPHYDIIVDAAYTGEAGAGEVPTYKTIGAALATISSTNEEQVVIFVKNGTYAERVVVTAPNVSILGEDADKTMVKFSAAVSEKTATGMWDRNAFYVDATADNFTLENIYVENTFAYTNGSDQQADALAIAADNVVVVNVNMIGYQDTLLVETKDKNGSDYVAIHHYFYNCYITGNVDFIYGSATAVFEDCDVVGRYTSYKPDGCYTATRTYANIPVGVVFNGCRFVAEDGIAAGAYRLARPWGKDASTLFLNCYMSDVVAEAGYGDWSTSQLAKDARYAEYNTYGPGFVVNNTRPLLSTAQADAYATAKVLDFDYVTVMDEMYTVPAVKYTVTVTADENGTATADVAKAAEGATVTLTATPNEGYEFDGWVVVAGDVVITDNTFVMPAANVEIKATFVDPNVPVEPPVEPGDTVDAFVARMYTIALERDVDPTGHADWVAGLANGTYDGAAVGRGVFLSPEFGNKNLSNEEFLNRLYATFFNRPADEAGFENWMNHLNANYSREFVLANFVNSQEFMNLCDEFDIERGTLLESGNAVNVGMSQFVTRLYNVVLLRTPDKDGYNDWTTQLGTGEKDAAAVAASFFGSQEYIQKNKSDEDFLKDVYKAFFDRDADEAGMNNWLANLAAGVVTRDNIFGLFTVEQEWLNLLDKYGL